MTLTQQYSKNISIWLVAILVLLPFASAAHESVHEHDSLSNDCHFCFQKVQQVLPSTELNISLPRIHHEAVDFASVQAIAAHTSLYHSRAPPSL